MMDRKSLLVLTAAGLTLSIMVVFGALAQGPVSPSAGAQQGGLPSFFDQRRLPGAPLVQANEAAKRLKAEETRRKAAVAEEEKARRQSIEAELEKLRRLTAEAEARFKVEEARRAAAVAEAQRITAQAQRQAEEAKRLAAEAEANRKKDEEARRAAALAKAKEDLAKSNAELQRLRAEAEAQRRAIAAEAEPKLSPEAARALAAKAAAIRKAEEKRLISARESRAASRRAANEARKRKQARQAIVAVPKAAAPADTAAPVSNPALSRYTTGIEDEFDAMEAGLEEEYDEPVPTLSAGAPATAGATVGSAITSSAVAAPLTPAPIIPSAVTVQACKLVSQSVVQGVLKLRVKTSGAVKGIVTARVGDIVHQASSAANGEVLLSAPLVSTPRAVTWSFPGNSRCSTVLDPITSDQLLRVALVWQGNADLNMHVLEPGAWMGGLYGHIWTRRPNLEQQAGAGRLNVFGATNSVTRMQVYSVNPRHIGKRRILNVMVDFTSRTNPPFCIGAGGSGRTIKYQVHIIRPPGPRGGSGPEVRNFEFAPKPCGTLISKRQRYEKLSLRP